MYYLLPFFVGFLIVFSAIVNGQLAIKVGTMKSIQMNYFVGSIMACLMTLLVGQTGGGLSRFQTLPAIFLIGSLFGLCVLLLMNTIVLKISTFYIVLLPFVGQMLVSACIDYFYLNYLSKGKIIGGLLILTGVVYNAIIERTSATS